MSLKGEVLKIIVLAVIGIPFIFIGGPILFPLLYLFRGYVVFCLKIDIFLIYLAARAPIFLFIEVPIKAFGKTSGFVSDFFDSGFSMMRNRKKTSIIIMLPIFLFFLWILQPPLTPKSGSPASIIRIAEGLGKLFVMSMTASLLILSAYAKWKGSDLGKSLFDRSDREILKEVGKSPAQAGIEATKDGRRNAEYAKQAKGVYDDIRDEGVKSTAKQAFWPSDMIKKVKSLIAEFKELVGDEDVSRKEVTVSAVGIFLFILLAVGLFLFQLAIVGTWIWAFYSFIGGPVMSALGLGTDYTSYFSHEFADKYLAAIGVDLSDELRMVSQAKQRVYCLLKGPACLRKWRLNNTRQPGSKAVGETYGLKIDRFKVGSGSRVDIAYKKGSYKLPISFGLSNNRHGLKGINAYNVSYKIKIIDFDRGRSNPFCQTGWVPINGYSIKKSDNVGKYRKNDLYPGTSASTGFLRLDELDLKNCEMLQPALGETRTVLLQVKYDYSSQATLYFQAMSRQNLLSNPNVKQKWKKSVTADTPVKASVNVNSPVLFTEQGGEYRAQPFSMRAGVKTDNPKVDFKVKSLEVRLSDKVEKRDSGSCQFREKSDKDNVLVPRDKANLISEGDGERKWFTSSNPPSFIGCESGLKLKKDALPQISPTGETLTMDVESNYTVRLNEKIDQFRVLNTRCSRFNCPLLVTEQFASGSSSAIDWRTRCEGVDAGNGCEVVRGGAEKWNRIQLLTGGRGNQRLDSQLEQGEVAIDPFTDNDIKVREGVRSKIEGVEKDGKEVAAIGLKPKDWSKINFRINLPGFNLFDLYSTAGFGLVSTKREGERDVKYRKLDKIVCAEQNINKAKAVDIYARHFNKSVGGDSNILVSFQPIIARCTSSDFWRRYVEDSNVPGPAARYLVSRLDRAEQYLQKQVDKVLEKCQKGAVVYDSSGFHCLKPQKKKSG